jgi:flagellar hook-associated protein 3 FlgL
MRITPGLISTQITADLQRALNALGRQQTLVSSNQRINQPSDDPGGAALALTIRARQAATAQFLKNVETARNLLGSTDSALGTVRDTLTRAHDLAVQGASDGNDALARKSIAVEVDQLLETLVSQANSRGTDGRYLFGGQESTTTPYTVARDASGRITAVTPNTRGIDGQTLAEVSEGLTLNTSVSGTSVFGATTDRTYAFDVLIRLRDRLDASNAVQSLAFAPDVDATGAATANGYAGVDTATALQIAGPLATAYVGTTTPADDLVSPVGAATSAIATAAAINAGTTTTGVSAVATQAQITYSAGGFAADVTLDGTPGQTLVINGVSVAGAISGASPTARRDALLALINGQVGGVVATASGATGLTLTAADGRNLSIGTDATTGAGTVNTEILGFTTGLGTETVVARGGVTLTAAHGFTTTENHATAEITGTGIAASVDAAIDELTATLDRAVIPSTVVGSRIAWLDTLDARLQTDTIAQAKSLSSVQDLDFVKAVEDLKQMETAYQAALASGATVLQQSLLNFLR